MQKTKIALAFVLVLTMFIVAVQPSYSTVRTVVSTIPYGTQFTMRATTQDVTSTDPTTGSGSRVKSFNYDLTGGYGQLPNPTFMYVGARSWLLDYSAAYDFRCIDYTSAVQGSPSGVTGPGGDIWNDYIYRHTPLTYMNHVTAAHILDHYPYGYPHYYTANGWDAITYTAFQNINYADGNGYNGYRPYDGACDCPSIIRWYYSNYPPSAQIPPVCP